MIHESQAVFLYNLIPKQLIPNHNTNFRYEFIIDRELPRKPMRYFFLQAFHLFFFNFIKPTFIFDL